MRIFLNMVMLSDHNLCIALKVIYPKAGINILGKKLYKTVVLEHLHFVEKNKIKNNLSYNLGKSCHTERLGGVRVTATAGTTDISIYCVLVCS